VLHLIKRWVILDGPLAGRRVVHVLQSRAIHLRVMSRIEGGLSVGSPIAGTGLSGRLPNSIGRGRDAALPGLAGWMCEAPNEWVGM
jgi:hypothetical protein